MNQKKCVVIVDEQLPIGLIANATAVLGVSIGNYVEGIVGPALVDRTGTSHPGIVSIPLPILTASRDELSRLREKALIEEVVQVYDFSETAQRCRTYEEYERVLAEKSSSDLSYIALAVQGEKKAVERLTGSLKTLR